MAPPGPHLRRVLARPGRRHVSAAAPCVVWNIELTRRNIAGRGGGFAAFGGVQDGSDAFAVETVLGP